MVRIALALLLVASGCQEEGVGGVVEPFYCPAREGHCLLLDGQAVTRGVANFPCKGEVRDMDRPFLFPTLKGVGKMVANQVTLERRCE